MEKKQLTSKGIENRLLGFERRVTKLEDKISEFRRDLVHNTVQIDRLADSFVKMEDRFMKEFEEFRSKMITLIDPLFGQLKKSNDEQTIHAGQHQEVYEKVEKLEKIHPKFSHAAI